MPRPLHACAATLTALAVAFLAVPVRSGAQTLAETAADPDLAGRVKITKGSSPNEKGEGPTPNLAKLDAPPKRVALVSFYVADEGKATGTYYSSTRKFTWLTQDGASHFAERYYDRGLQALKEAFGRQGMQIVTHEEFLDTEAKRKAYLAYKLEMSLAVRVALGDREHRQSCRQRGGPQAVGGGARLSPADHPSRGHRPESRGEPQ